MNKNYIVVGKCADGSVIISEDGETFFDLKTAIEIANDHKKNGLDVVVMRVKEMEFERIVRKQHYNELGTEFAENFVFTYEFEEWIDKKNRIIYPVIYNYISKQLEFVSVHETGSAEFTNELKNIKKVFTKHFMELINTKTDYNIELVNNQKFIYFQLTEKE